MIDEIHKQKIIVFAAMSKELFFLREHIIKFILEEGYTPTSAFMMYSYFLLDTIDRKALIRANNELIRHSDELWVFGHISEGVQAEIDLANELQLPIRYFEYNCNSSPCSFTQRKELESDES